MHDVAVEEDGVSSDQTSSLSSFVIWVIIASNKLNLDNKKYKNTRMVAEGGSDIGGNVCQVLAWDNAKVVVAIYKTAKTQTRVWDKMVISQFH